MAELEEEDAGQHGSILGYVKGLFSGSKDQDSHGHKQVQILSGITTVVSDNSVCL